MELLIYNYTGYENEFEVSIIENGKIKFDYYVSNIHTTLSMNEDGKGKVRVNTISCITYDENDKPIPYVLTQDQIEALERSLPDYVDWNDWSDINSSLDDDYQESQFNSMD